jgi:hypothetical protein
MRLPDEAKDWRMWAGAFVGILWFYGMFWLVAMGCVVMGYSQEACGI